MITRTRRIGIISALLVLCILPTAYAFRSWGLWHIHQKITKKAIGDVVAKKTLKKIHKANRGADRGANFNDPTLHFDNEMFQASAQKLADNLNGAMDDLDACDKEMAVEKIGQALHALQDFYSHSIWAENQNSGPLDIPSNIPIFIGLVGADAAGTFSPGSLTADPTFTPVCTPNPGPPVDDNTSGYFPDGSEPPGKCTHKQLNKDYHIASGQHGSPRGSFTVPATGFNLYEYAFDVAKRHTTALFTLHLRQALADRFGQVRGDELWDFLIGDNRDIAFAIDRTRSMSGELPGIKTAIISKLNEFEAAGESPVLSLITFGDTVTFIGTECTPSDFIPLINAIQANTPDGDCPEKSLTAMYLASDKVGAGGHVYVATDASPSEGGDLKDAVISIAKEKDVKVSIMLSGDCGLGGAAPGGGLPAVATYSEIATETGGLFFQVTTDFEPGTNLILDTAAPELTDLALVEDQIVLPDNHFIPVPVDNTIERIEFSMNSLDGGVAVFRILRPDGTVVLSADPDAEFVSTPEVQHWSITSPVVGEWQMWIIGDVEYAAWAAGASDIAFLDFTFLHLDESGELPQDVPVCGSPAVGDTVLLEAELVGEGIGGVSFDLVFADGTLADTVIMTEEATEPDPSEGYGLFLGDYTPAGILDRFLVRASGIDAQGAPFQRVLRRWFEVAPDCNNNAVDDSCDIADGTSADCNGNGVPDECDLPPIGSGSDCNSNGVPDECDVPPIGSGSDCNINGIPDECDISDGTSADCSGNGIPDECEPDCNGNGQADSCDIFLRRSPDANSNCVPDECDCFTDPQQISTHTDLDFSNVGFGDVAIMFGFAQTETLAASYVIAPEDFPIEIRSVEMVFAQETNQATTTEWTMYVWQGTPDAGPPFAELSSDGISVLHLQMPAGDEVAVLTVVPEAGSIIVPDNGSATFSVGFSIDVHNDPSDNPCLANRPMSSNAFPAVDKSGVSDDENNWMNFLNCGPFDCPFGWLAFQDLALCEPDGDWALRVVGVPAAPQDCNVNGVPDYCEIEDGTRLDTDGDGVLDECGCPWDFDGDGVIGPIDLATLLGAWGPYGPCPPLRQPDFDQDYDVGPIDLATLLGAWGPCPMSAQGGGDFFAEGALRFTRGGGGGGGCLPLEDAVQMLGFDDVAAFIEWILSSIPAEAVYHVAQFLLWLLEIWPC